MVSFAGLGTVDSRTDVLPPGGSVHQETDVELSDPLAPGWARANCSGPVKASLLYRQHNSAGMPTAEAGVNATAVPATRFVTFAEQGEGQFGTGVAYANPSATSAHVTFTARDTAGEVLASVDRTLLPGGHDAHGMSELFDLTSFTGSIEVTSTEPIVSLSLNFEAAPVFSSLPPGELDAAAQGSTTYYFPHLAVGASWQTTITYINYSREEVTCRTDFISDHGTPLMVSFAELGMVDSRTDVLPPGGSVHQETDVALSAPLAPGWARATCSGPVQASLLFRQHNSEGMPTAEAGVNATAVPATRFVTFAEQGEGKNGTGVAYANPFFTSALVTFTARDADGEVLAIEDLMLPPNGHGAQNMPPLFDLSSFTGSLEVTSTVPIVSLSLNFEAAPVFSSLPPGDIPGEMLAPTDEAAFNELVVGKRVLSPHPAYYTDFVSPGRFRETEGSDIWTGSYTYRNTGPNTGTVTFNYDDGDRCVASFTFVSTTAGTATYTCNDGESGESNWLLVAISATGAPDLVVQTPSVSDSSPNAGGSFTLSATVRNQGNGLSASTTLRYYRSPDATISTSDTAVGTDAVGGLAASGTSAESISLTAPSTAGTYYYGACVDPVSGESATGNNCSDSRAVTVRSGSMAVIIPDVNLRAAIEAALGKASGAPIYKSDMQSLKILDPGWLNEIGGIRDLEGIQFATNLEELRLRSNHHMVPSTPSLTPLAGLMQLKLLDLGAFNNIEDPAPLDLAPLADLVNLSWLNLAANNVMNISALNSMTKLTWLSIRINDISDISALSDMSNLVQFYGQDNEIARIESLRGLTELQTVVLWLNEISDLAPLASNPGLSGGDVVDVRNNPLSTVSTQTHIPNLRARGVEVSFSEIVTFERPQTYNDNLFVIPVTERLSEVDTHLRSYVDQVLEHFGDVFDFVIFVPNASGERSYFAEWQNNVTGIGLDITETGGRLQGVINMGGTGVGSSSVFNRGISIIREGPMLHELMHKWANFVVPSSYRSHWGFSSANGVLGGFDIADLVDYGGGRYSAGHVSLAGAAGNIIPYAPIELYLAGLIPPDEVPDLWVAENGEYLYEDGGTLVYDDRGYVMFTANQVSTYTIEDIIAEHGARIPDSRDSQREFRAVVVLLVNEENPATRELLDMISRDVAWFGTADSDEYPFIYNFHEATGGRATITLDGLD